MTEAGMENEQIRQSEQIQHPEKMQKSEQMQHSEQLQQPKLMPQSDQSQQPKLMPQSDQLQQPKLMPQSEQSQQPKQVPLSEQHVITCGGNSVNDDRGSSCCDKSCAECERHKHRSKEEYRSLTNRLNRIEGQIRGIRQMVDNERYCVDILTQVSAVQSALNAFNRELLTRHIKSCVTEDIRGGNEAAVDELCATLQKLMK